MKFLAFPLVVLILFNHAFSRKIEIDSIVVFYLLITVAGFLSYFVEIVRHGFALNAAILVFFSLLMWILYLLVYLMLKSWITYHETEEVEWVLETFFKFNALLCLLQYFMMVYEFRSINPFTSELATSAGDNIKGIFSNSSANMVSCSFYSIYFLTTKKFRYFVLTVMIILFTSYMSGILIYIVAFLFFFLFNKKVNVRAKLVSIGLFLLFGSFFYYISYDNITYAYSIIESVFTLSPPRKIVSFVQTYEFMLSDLFNFLFGASPAHFSSRFAFIGGGEFVKWYPSFLSFRSINFNLNHFQLWNFDVLNIPFNDGTGNQPFSFYNQVIGEYGIIGLSIFLFLYLRGVMNKLKGLNYAFLFTILMMLFFFLDYWYEYLAPMIIFEFILLFLYKNVSKFKIQL